MLGDEILRLLACPLCKVDVRLDGDRILCPECGRRYPVRDGIPIMLIEEAERTDGGDEDPDSGVEEGY